MTFRIIGRAALSGVLPLAFASHVLADSGGNAAIGDISMTAKWFVLGSFLAVNALVILVAALTRKKPVKESTREQK